MGTDTKNLDNIVYNHLGGQIMPAFRNFNDIHERVYNAKAKTVTFVVTHQCSLRCTYCYEHCKEDKHMSWEVGKRCIDFLFEQDAKNSKYINSQNCDAIILDFIGGEPLLEIELIHKMCDYFVETAIKLNHRWQNNFVVSMSTNGVDLFKPKCMDFITKYKTKLSVNVTIDGNKELHDKCRLFPDGSPSYDICIKAALWVKEYFNNSLTKITLAPGNIEYLFEAVKDLTNTLTPTHLHGNPCFEKGWEPIHSKIYYDQLIKMADWIIENEVYRYTFNTFFDTFIGQHLPDTETKNWCGGTGDMLAFDVDGTVYPCLRYSPISIGDEKAAKMALGNVFDGILCTECQIQCSHMLDSITRQSQSTKECLDCPINSGCAWCSAYNYEVNGTPNSRVTYICGLHKARCLANCYYWNKLAEKLDIPERLSVNCPKEWALEIIPEMEYNKLVELSTGIN